MGTIFAIIAFASWGLGDFLIQKTTRKFGDWISLWYITASATIVLFPFVFRDIPELFSKAARFDLLILLLAGAVSTAASLLLFEGLKKGKIAVIDPIFAFEVVITTLLAWLFLNEVITVSQMFLILLLVIGIALISIKSFSHFKKIKLEAGIIFAILATIAMGAENFLTGLGARLTDALMVNWFGALFITIVTSVYIIFKKRVGEISSDLKKRPGLILAVSFTDNLGWIGYSYSMTFIPMALATGISEAYIALAAMLGLVITKEKIKKHQIAGLIITIIAAIALALSASYL